MRFQNILFFARTAILAGGLFTAQAQAFDIDILLENVRDPESPEVSDEVRVMSAAVASLGVEEGSYLFDIEDDFLDRTIAQVSTLLNQAGPIVTAQMRVVDTPVMEYLAKNYGMGVISIDGDIKLVVPTGLRGEVIAMLEVAQVIDASTYGFIEHIDLKGDLLESRTDIGAGSCSGFLVGDRHLATNHHCLSTQAKCDKAAFRFNEELSDDLQTLKGVVSFDCKQVVLEDPDFDLTIVELETTIRETGATAIPGEMFGHFELAERPPGFAYGVDPRGLRPDYASDPLVAIGHPASHEGYEQGKEFQTIKKVTRECFAQGTPSLVGVELPIPHLAATLIHGRVVEHQRLVFSMPTDCPIVGGNSGSVVVDQNLQALGIMSNAKSDWMYSRSTAPVSNFVPSLAIIIKHRERLEELGIIKPKKDPKESEENSNPQPLVLAMKDFLSKALASAEASNPMLDHGR